jgi:cell division septum initiation protein DivIVA
MTDLDTSKPQFEVGESGYDPAQVDAHLAHLQRLVADAQERARNAEAEYVFDQHAAIGPRIAEIFALAEAEARELRERFSAEGAALISEARNEARAIIDAAEQAARELRERLERDQRAMLGELQHDRERIHGEVNVLELRKGKALAELRRLSELLGEATNAAHADSEARGTEVRSAPGPARLVESSAQTLGSSAETAELPVVTAGAKRRQKPPRTPPATDD